MVAGFPTAKRSANDHLDTDQLVADLVPFATLKTWALDWEFDGYSKNKRSQGPDREGLEKYLMVYAISRQPILRPVVKDFCGGVGEGAAGPSPLHKGAAMCKSDV